MDDCGHWDHSILKNNNNKNDFILFYHLNQPQNWMYLSPNSIKILYIP